MFVSTCIRISEAPVLNGAGVVVVRERLGRRR